MHTSDGPVFLKTEKLPKTPLFWLVSHAEMALPPDGAAPNPQAVDGIMNMQFVHDPNKNEESIAKHSVSSEEAAGFWEDPDSVILHAKRHGNAIRIIWTRRATRKERMVYEHHNRH